MLDLGMAVIDDACDRQLSGETFKMSIINFKMGLGPALPVPIKSMMICNYHFNWLSPGKYKIQYLQYEDGIQVG